MTASTGIGSPVPGRTPSRAWRRSSSAASAWPAVAAASSARSSPSSSCSLVRTDLTFLGVNPNLSTVIQGVILIGVVMFGSLRRDAEGARMSAGVGTAGHAQPVADCRRWRRLFRDRPLDPAWSACWSSSSSSSSSRRPGIVIADWVGVTLRAAIPLAILARLPDADDAHRRHRPVRGRGGVDGRLRDGDLVHGQGRVVAVAIGPSVPPPSPGWSTGRRRASSRSTR